MEQKKQFINFKEINEKTALKAKMQEFLDSFCQCEQFCWKIEDKRTRTAWCKITNSGCRYCKCPKIKHDD